MLFQKAVSSEEMFLVNIDKKEEEFKLTCMDIFKKLKIFVFYDEENTYM